MFNISIYTDHVSLRDAAANLADAGWTTDDREELHRRQLADAHDRAEAEDYALTEEDLDAIEEGFAYMLRCLAEIQAPKRYDICTIRSENERQTIYYSYEDHMLWSDHDDENPAYGVQYDTVEEAIDAADALWNRDAAGSWDLEWIEHDDE